MLGGTSRSVPLGLLVKPHFSGCQAQLLPEFRWSVLFHPNCFDFVEREFKLVLVKVVIEGLLSVQSDWRVQSRR